MAQSRPAEAALRLLHSRRQEYVCRTCRAHRASIRALHTSRVLAADVASDKPVSTLERLRQNLFGRKTPRAAVAPKEPVRTPGKPAKDGQQKRATGQDGKKYRFAQVVIPGRDSNYVRAVDWDGLDSVGSEAWVKARADKGEVYEGFLPPERVELSAEQWDCLLHAVVVEALSLARAGRNLDDIFLPHSSMAAQSVSIVPGATVAETALKMENGRDAREVLDAIPTERPSDISPTNDLAQSIIVGEMTPQPHHSSSWTKMGLNDAKLKFVIIKRVMQLTGHRVSDNVVSNAKTISDLLKALKTREPPKKLAHSDELQSAHTALPNVVVYHRRRTPIDKDTDVGRWKLIEQELRKRGLPVTGTTWPTAKVTVPRG